LLELAADAELVTDFSEDGGKLARVALDQRGDIGG
jgi:hypothetical protein